MMPGWHHAVSEQAYGLVNWKPQLNFMRRHHPGYADGKWTNGFAKEINFFATNLKLTDIFDAILYSKNIKENNF